MPARNLTFEPLRTSLRNRNFSPIYILHGEEGFFIDALLRDFETILPEEERDFNQSVLYAPRTDISMVSEVAKRVPMMSDFQVVILKEAQAVRADELDKLTKYVENPSPSTILVVAGRGAVLKGKMLAAAKKSDKVVIFEAKKVSDRDLPGYIQNHINNRGLNVQPKALEMLREYIGSDLSRLYNEIDKLMTILGSGATVTPEAIEQHIGYSKSYNAFELVDALAARDAARVYRIADYFRANPKAVPLVLATSSIFSFFSDLLITYFVKDKSERGLMTALGIKWPIQMRKFNVGRTKYNAFQVIEIIRAIRNFDRSSKGVGSRRNEHELFRELMFHILTAPGNLFPEF